MNIPDDTKPCACGKLMIARWTGQVLCSNPPQYPTQWYCGGCGATETGPTLRDDSPTQAEIDLARWKQANEWSEKP